MVQFVPFVTIRGVSGSVDDDKDSVIDLARGDGCWHTVQQHEATRRTGFRQNSLSSLSLGDLEDSDDEDAEDSLSLGSGSHGGINSDAGHLVDRTTTFAPVKTGIGTLLSSTNNSGAKEDDAEVEVKNQMARQVMQRANGAARKSGRRVARNAGRVAARQCATDSARYVMLRRSVVASSSFL